MLLVLLRYYALFVLLKVGFVFVISVANGIIRASVFWRRQNYGFGCDGTNSLVIEPEG
jgi:hypothetical protein